MKKKMNSILYCIIKYLKGIRYKCQMPSIHIVVCIVFCVFLFLLQFQQIQIHANGACVYAKLKYSHTYIDKYIDNNNNNNDDNNDDDCEKANCNRQANKTTFYSLDLDNKINIFETTNNTANAVIGLKDVYCSVHHRRIF